VFVGVVLLAWAVAGGVVMWVGLVGRVVVCGGWCGWLGGVLWGYLRDKIPMQELQLKNVGEAYMRRGAFMRDATVVTSELKVRFLVQTVSQRCLGHPKGCRQTEKIKYRR